MDYRGGPDVRRRCQAPDPRGREKDDGHRDREAREGRHRDLRRDRRRRRPTSCCSSAWTAAASTPCIPPPPRRSAPPPTSAPPTSKGAAGPGARRRRTRSASRSPPAPSAGPRWKAAARSWSTANASAASASPAATGRLDQKIAQEAVEAIGARLEMTRTAARRLHRHGLVVGRARRRDQALRQARDRRLLHPLGGQARAFAKKYGCRAAASYEEMLADPSIEAIINTTPNDVHLETTRAAAEAGKHVFLDKPIANTVADGARHHRGLPQGRRRARARLPAAPREPFPLDQAADRRRRVRQAGQRGSQHQPRPARQDRPQLLALPGRRACRAA